MRRYIIKTIFVILFNLPLVLIYSIKSDEQIADEIIVILLKEYGNVKDKSALEKIVLTFSKKPYMESLSEWRKNFNDLSGIKIRLNSTIENVVVIAAKRLSYEEGLRFRTLFENLTMIGYENLQIYFVSTKKYLQKNQDAEITIELINEAKCEPVFMKMKVDSYEKEKLIKQEIRLMFKDARLKNRMAFYSFAFDFLDKLRTRIIEQEIRRMKEKALEIND